MNDCIFCKIIAGESPADFLLKDDDLVVFKDKYPHSRIHLLIVPKKHIRSINDLQDEDLQIVSKLIDTGKKMALETGVSISGYKLLFNVERGGGQVIFHLHLHLLAN